MQSDDLRRRLRYDYFARDVDADLQLREMILNALDQTKGRIAPGGAPRHHPGPRATPALLTGSALFEPSNALSAPLFLLRNAAMAFKHAHIQKPMRNPVRSYSPTYFRGSTIVSIPDGGAARKLRWLRATRLTLFRSAKHDRS